MSALEHGRRAEPTAEQDLSGTIFAQRYRIDGRIGTGGMGVVYRAYQLDMDRWVALKVLKPQSTIDLPVAEWFCREMRAAARIQHPNTVRVHDFGRTSRGSLYLAMELLVGKTLEEDIYEQGPMRPSRLIHIAIQVAKALRAAHAERVVHRDLKADNILLVDLYGEPDFVKVVDFGIAFIQGADSGALDAGGMVIGTPEYMSPEQACNRPVDHRADLYALGVLIYQMATGRPPFLHDDPTRVLAMHVNDTPVPPSQRVQGGVPEPIERTILRLLAKDPAERPQTATEVVETLGQCANHEQVNRRSTRREVGAAPPASPVPPILPIDSPPPLPPIDELYAAPRTIAVSRAQLGIPAPDDEDAGPTSWMTPAPAGPAHVPPRSTGRVPARGAQLDVDIRALQPGRFLLGAAAVLLVLLIAATGLWLAFPIQPRPVPRAVTAPRVAQLVATSAQALTRPQVAAPRVDRPVEEVAVLERRTIDVTTPRAEGVRLSVRSQPEGARVLWEGREIGVTPFDLPVEHEAQGELVFRLKGYTDREVRFRAADGSISAELSRAPRRTVSATIKAPRRKVVPASRDSVEVPRWRPRSRGEQ